MEIRWWTPPYERGYKRPVLFLGKQSSVRGHGSWTGCSPCRGLHAPSTGCVICILSCLLPGNIFFQVPIFDILFCILVVFLPSPLPNQNSGPQWYNIIEIEHRVRNNAFSLPVQLVSKLPFSNSFAINWRNVVGMTYISLHFRPKCSI